MSMPFITLHASQIDQFVNATHTDDTPRSRVQASPEVKTFAIQACRAAGITVPAAGGWTLKELDAALDAAFPAGNPTSLRRRMEMKSNLYAAGMILEPPDPSEKRNTVVAVLHCKKASIPLPNGKPYTVAEFDALLAEKDDISLSHRLEIKQACLKGGLVQDSVRKLSTQPLPQTIHAAEQVLSALGLDVPVAGKKLSIVAVDDAMAHRGWDMNRSVSAKSTLAAAGVL